MLKTVITKRAVERVQARSDRLLITKARTREANQAVSTRSRQLFSKPVSILVAYAFGVIVGAKKNAPEDKSITLKETKKAVVLETRKSNSSLLLSILGTVVSAISLYYRLTRVNRKIVESHEDESKLADIKAL